MIVGSGVQAAAAREPGRTALVAGRSRLSFGELDRAIDAAGAGFRALGLERGARLVIALPNGAEYLIAFFAAARAGLVAVTLPSGAGAADLAAALVQARPQAVLGTAAWLAAHGEIVRAHATGARCIAVADGSDPRGEAGPARDGVVPWHAVVGAAGAPPPPPVPGDPFYIGYTSGSTGRPKGVVRRHEAWVRSFAAATTMFGLGPGDRFLVPGPLHFSASLFHACHVLEIGGTVYLETRFDPRRLARRLAAERITGAFMVPTHYQALIDPDAHHLAGIDTASVRTLISCGEKLRPAVRESLERHFPRARVFEYYGSSELGFTTVAGPGPGPARSVGRPAPGVEVVIRRPDGIQAAPGEVGVLYARSPMMAAGYDGDGGSIVPFTDPDGWATVGDLARMEPDGTIFLEGRADEVINTGGAKVYPVEVEAVLAAHPAVSEVVVFGLPDARRGEVVAAAVVLRPGERASQRDLHAFCATRLAPYKRPRVFHFVPELPRTDTGKVSRTALRARLLPGSPDGRSWSSR